MIEVLTGMCFSDFPTVKKWLKNQGITLIETEFTCICKNPNHNITVGFDWESLDYYTRGTQLQMVLFGGYHFFDLTSSIQSNYKQFKVRG